MCNIASDTGSASCILFSNFFLVEYQDVCKTAIIKDGYSCAFMSLASWIKILDSLLHCEKR